MLRVARAHSLSLAAGVRVRPESRSCPCRRGRIQLRKVFRAPGAVLLRPGRVPGAPGSCGTASKDCGAEIPSDPSGSTVNILKTARRRSPGDGHPQGDRLFEACGRCRLWGPVGRSGLLLLRCMYLPDADWHGLFGRYRTGIRTSLGCRTGGRRPRALRRFCAGGVAEPGVCAGGGRAPAAPAARRA